MSSCFYNSIKLESLPKGFRFHPDDDVLIDFYLRHKINGNHSKVDIIREVDVCKWEPWDLPALSVVKSDEQEWFFFSPLDKKYRNGYRFNRATEAGYWKATGKDRNIISHKPSSSSCTHSHIVGLKKTLVFYKGRAPRGERTSWLMHEYRVNEPGLDGTASRQGNYVICRLFHKADDKLNDNEVEHTGSLPSCSTSKSTPEETAVEESAPLRDLGLEATYNQFVYDPSCIEATDGTSGQELEPEDESADPDGSTKGSSFGLRFELRSGALAVVRGSIAFSKTVCFEHTYRYNPVTLFSRFVDTTSASLV